MTVFENILQDYKYIESIKNKHDELLKKASNSEWKFVSIEFYPNSDGICEYSYNLDHRHRGLTKLYLLENRQDGQRISVGATCYKKIMGIDLKVNPPSIQKWIISQENLKLLKEKNFTIQKNLKIFIHNELPQLRKKAVEYQITFDELAFLQEIQDVELLGYGVARIRHLKIAIKKQDRLKRDKENKEYLERILSTNSSVSISEIDKNRAPSDELKKLKTRRDTAYKKAPKLTKAELQYRRREIQIYEEKRELEKLERRKNEALKKYLPKIKYGESTLNVKNELINSGWSSRAAKDLIRNYKKNKHKK